MKKINGRAVFLSVLIVVAVVLLVMPFHNYPPTDSSSWASWVQAFGSMAAIGLAIWLQGSSETGKRTAATEAAKLFVGRFNISLGILEGAVAVQDWGEFKSQLAVLNELMRFGRTLPIFDANSDQQSVVVDLQGIGALLLAQNAAEHQVKTWSGLKRQLSEFRVRVDKSAKFFGLLPLADAIALEIIQGNLTNQP